MTPEEIKKIAEEYARELYSKEDYNLMQKGELDFETEEAIRDCMAAFVCHINYLAERYFVVEKSKVKQERRYYEVTEWVDGDSISDLIGDIKDTFENLFGSEIGKEEEDA